MLPEGGKIPPKVKDITGQEYGRLTAIRFSRINKRIPYWYFKCSCNNPIEKEISYYSVNSGKTKSCGCLQKEVTIKRNKQRIVSEQQKKATLKKAKKKYQSKNKEKLKEESIKYHKKNKDKINTRKRTKYYQDLDTSRKNARKRAQTDTARSTRNKRRQQRKKEDPNYRIYESLRTVTTKYLSRKKIKKTTIFENLIQCSRKKLKEHLESQFKEGMSWNNRGLYGWHIDHILPLASFDLTDLEQQKKAFHYTNLQPLWAKENLSKGAKIPKIDAPQKEV